MTIGPSAVLRCDMMLAFPIDLVFREVENSSRQQSLLQHPSATVELRSLNFFLKVIWPLIGEVNIASCQCPTEAGDLDGSGFLSLKKAVIEPLPSRACCSHGVLDRYFSSVMVS